MLAFYRTYPDPSACVQQAVAQFAGKPDLRQPPAKLEGAEKVQQPVAQLSFHERELETNLLHQLERFLLELGQGFAFVGRQYELRVGERDFHIDLLFYHLKLRSFVVIDLKKGEFKPEHAGKMNFYLSVVDDQIRHVADAPSIGLILCQDRNRIVAEYALRDMEKPIGISEYELTRALPASLRSALPTVEEIEAELFASASADLAEPEALP